MSIKIGIAGPVGSGKTSIIEKLTNMLKDEYSLGIVTNDIYNYTLFAFIYKQSTF